MDWWYSHRILLLLFRKHIIMSKIFQAIKQLFSSKTRESFVKLVGTDRFENKFYERLPGKIYFF